MIAEVKLLFGRMLKLRKGPEKFKLCRISPCDPSRKGSGTSSPRNAVKIHLFPESRWFFFWGGGACSSFGRFWEKIREVGNVLMVASPLGIKSGAAGMGRIPLGCDSVAHSPPLESGISPPGMFPDGIMEIP